MTKGGFSVCHRKNILYYHPNLLPKWEVTYWEFIYNNRCDAMVRYKRLMGFDVFYLTGVDEQKLKKSC